MSTKNDFTFSEKNKKVENIICPFLRFFLAPNLCMQKGSGQLEARSGLILSCNKKFNWRDLKTYTSLFIRLGNQSNWSHTARTILIHNILFVIDSDFGLGRNGIAITPWAEWRKNKNDLFVYDPINASLVKRFDPNVIVNQDKKALTQCGVAKYDLNGFRYQIKKAITGHWEGETDEVAASSQFYCSEFVAWIYSVNKWFLMTPDNLVRKRSQIFPSHQDLYEGPANLLEFK